MTSGMSPAHRACQRQGRRAPLDRALLAARLCRMSRRAAAGSGPRSEPGIRDLVGDVVLGPGGRTPCVSGARAASGQSWCSRGRHSQRADQACAGMHGRNGRRRGWRFTGRPCGPCWTAGCRRHARGRLTRAAGRPGQHGDAVLLDKARVAPVPRVAGDGGAHELHRADMPGRCRIRVRPQPAPGRAPQSCGPGIPGAAASWYRVHGK
jgi:hypothetical protein